MLTIFIGWERSDDVQIKSDTFVFFSEISLFKSEKYHFSFSSEAKTSYFLFNCPNICIAFPKMNSKKNFSQSGVWAHNILIT